MSIKPAKFQQDAAAAAVAAFNSGRPCYLIADETGLGKTIVARTIIEQMSKNNKPYKPFKVYYFGSNQMLLSKTIEKLRKGNERVWEHFDETTKLGMMAGRKLEGSVVICGFSGNLLGESGSSGDDVSERPYYNRLLHNNPNLVNYLSNTCECKQLISNWTKNNSLKTENITPLRKFLEKYTLEHEKPDLIILDEFHRYDKSVVYLQDLLKKIKRENKEYTVPPMLLLSATPYNLYGNPTSISDVFEDEGSSDDSNKIQSFDVLLERLDYLAERQLLKTEYEKFKKNPDTDGFSEFLIDNCIYRNERLSDGSEKYQTLPTTEDFQTVFAPCIKEEKKLRNCDFLRYRKLCSGVCSFPIRYYYPGDEKEKIFYDKLPKPVEKNVPDDDMFVFDDEGKLKRDKEGLFNKNLRFACIEHYNAKQGRDLLWVPPTKPEYGLGGVFAENQQSFSKLMIFSAYKMVPRIISGVFSAYVSDDVEVSPEVDLAEIDKIMQEKFSGKFDDLNELYSSLVCGDNNYNAESIIDALVKELQKKYPDCNDIRLLAKYVIGSPYMCAMRVFGKDNAEAVKDAFNSYFKKEGIKQAIAHNGITKSEELLDYCINGGLGAVLQEYAFCDGSTDNLIKALLYGTEQKTVVNVYTHMCYKENSEPIKLKCHYAERFNTDYTDENKSSTSSDGVTHFMNCQTAFNSPFWPMILCTTSANQEGYDLDTFCSRIMHYSLPPNTMSFEQRDGRINRRRSLLARRRMVQMFGTKESWEDLFNNFKDNSGMSPDWTQEGYFDECSKNNIEPLRLERILPYFPMTDEYYAYELLREMKNKYRSHFGLPDESRTSQSAATAALTLNKLKKDTV